MDEGRPEPETSCFTFSRLKALKLSETTQMNLFETETSSLHVGFTRVTKSAALHHGRRPVLCSQRASLRARRQLEVSGQRVQPL